MFQVQNHSKLTPHFAGPGTINGPAGGRIQRITFCADGQARMRPIVARSRMRPTWKYPSIKNTALNNHAESPNERTAFCFLDFDWRVLAYREQPCEIVYLDDDGVERRHFPDIEVVALTGPQLWEIKPERFANWDAIRRRTEILSEDLPLWGFQYLVVTAEELNQQPRLDNMLGVLDFARRPVTSSERAMIAEQLQRSGQILWRDALDGKYGVYGRDIVCRLVIEGRLQMDMQKALTDKTEFVHGPVRC